MCTEIKNQQYLWKVFSKKERGQYKEGAIFIKYSGKGRLNISAKYGRYFCAWFDIHGNYKCIMSYYLVFKIYMKVSSEGQSTLSEIFLSILNTLCYSQWRQDTYTYMLLLLCEPLIQYIYHVLFGCAI